MILSHKLWFLFIILMLQACSSVKKPYSTILQSPPTIIKTSVGNTEVWKWAPKTGSTTSLKGVAYLIPGFPGSSLENAPLAHALTNHGYATRLINPPAHGQNPIENEDWNFKFNQYGQALYESFNTLKAQSSPNKSTLIIAHSAGAEMALKFLLTQTNKANLYKNYTLVLINPWMPSITNHPIPWTEDDKDILKYSSTLIKLFGPFSKGSTHNRLFSHFNRKKTTDYLHAHEKLTEDFNGWGTFYNRFTHLVKATTRTQKDILDMGEKYELSLPKITQLRTALLKANATILVINSAGQQDKMIPLDYKLKLNNALSSKLNGINIKFTDISNGGHLLQVEQPVKIIKAITTQ